MLRLCLIIATLVPLIMSGVYSQEAPASAYGVGYITFVSDATSDGNEDIFIVDSTGSNLYNLTVNPARDWHPTWSPDGRQIAFTSNRGGGTDIYIMDANGENQTPLRETSGIEEGAPAWSPDGQHIAYVAVVDGAPQIFSLTIGSDTPDQLTYDAAQKGAPAWSPDGRQISFWRVSADDTSITEIVVVDRISLNETVVVPDGVNNWPAYSPNNDQLAFFRVENQIAKLFTLDFNSDQVYELSDSSSEVSDLQPTWSPDGEQLAFTSSRDGKFQIYAQIALGAGTGFGTFPRRLVYLDGNAHSPEWQPLYTTIDFDTGSINAMGQNARIIQSGDLQSNTAVDSGQLEIFAPIDAQSDEVITIRLELKTDTLLNSMAAAPPTAETESPSRLVRPISVYQFMGAELVGFDIRSFESYPDPSGYVIAVDPNAVNYWEWQIRAINADVHGRKDLIARVYLPQSDENGVTGQVELLREAFSISIYRPGERVEPLPEARSAPLNSEQVFDGVPSEPVPSLLNTPHDPPSVQLTYTGPELFSVIFLTDVDINGVTFSTARFEADLVSAFEVLEEMGGVAQGDMCLHFALYDSRAPIPMVCEDRRNFRREVQSNDVFWYDFNQASLLTTVVRAKDQSSTIEICPGNPQDPCEF